MTGVVHDGLLPAAETARLFGRSLRTLSNWEAAKVLVPIRIRGRRYYRISDIEAFVSEPDGASCK